VGVDEPPPGREDESSPRETPWNHAPRPAPPSSRDEAPRGLSMGAKVVAGAFVAALYAGGMGFRGDWLPGIVGGILAGIVLVMVLNRIEQRRRR
jgi:hypothetical protein